MMQDAMERRHKIQQSAQWEVPQDTKPRPELRLVSQFANSTQQILKAERALTS